MSEVLLDVRPSGPPRLSLVLSDELQRRCVPGELVKWLQETPAALEQSAFMVLVRFAYLFGLKGRGEALLEAMERKVREGLARRLFRRVSTDRALKWALVELMERKVDNSTLPLIAAALACRAADLAPLCQIESAAGLRLSLSRWNGRGVA